jgi:hypothetical protein
MTQRKKTTSDVLRALGDTLTTAELGLKDVVSNPERRLTGFRNLVVFGRAITNVLQNLRSTEADFDSWYAPYVQEMQADPLLRYFYELRSEVLKEGTLRAVAPTYIRSLSLPRDLGKLGPPPPNARSFFIGDQSGGSGWEVQLADGAIVKYYVELPEAIGKVDMYLSNAPRSHLGHEISDPTLIVLSQLYMEYMRRLVNAAVERFGAPG